MISCEFCKFLRTPFSNNTSERLLLPFEYILITVAYLGSITGPFLETLPKFSRKLFWKTYLIIFHGNRNFITVFVGNDLKFILQ